MRFDVSSTALLSRLQSISKVIASKNSLPILDSFLFNLEGNKLTILTTITWKSLSISRMVNIILSDRREIHIRSRNL